MALSVNSTEASGTAHRSGATPLTWSFTNTAGTLLLVAVVVTKSDAAIGSISVTYNGVSMTSVSAAFTWDSGKTGVQWFYLVNPATGANTVSVTWADTTGSTRECLAGAISFTGQDASPIGTNTTGSANPATSVSASNITTASGNYVVAAGGFGSGSGGTAGTGFTRTFLLNGSGNTAGDNIIGEYQASSGAAITPSFGWTGSDAGGIQAVEIIASGGGGGGPTVTYPDLERLTRGLERGLLTGVIH